MNLKEFHYLVAVDKYKNFSKAAQACCVSQPTLSAQIKKYEEYLAVKLFDRASKNIITTEVGQKIIECAHQILAQEAQIKEIAQTYDDPFKGEYRIGCFPTLAPYFFPTLVPIIKTHFPKVSLKLVEEKTSILIEQLNQGQLDLLFLALPIEAANIQSFHLFDDAFKLAVPTNHPLSKRKKINPSDIQDEELLLLEEGHCLRSQALSFCSEHQWQAKVNYRASSLETLRQMVIAGSGLTLIPQTAINSHETGIHYLSFTKPVPVRSIALVIKKNSTRLPFAKALSECIKDIGYI